MDWRDLFFYGILLGILVTCWLLLTVLARGALGFVGRALRGPRHKRPRG